MSGRGKKKLAKSGFKISLYLFKEKLLFPKSQHGQGKTMTYCHGNISEIFSDMPTFFSNVTITAS